MDNTDVRATASPQPALLASLPEPVPVSAHSGDGQAQLCPATLERCAQIAELWRDQNKAQASKARLRDRRAEQFGFDANGMADMLEGAAIECNAIAHAIRSLAQSPSSLSQTKG